MKRSILIVLSMMAGVLLAPLSMRVLDKLAGAVSTEITSQNYQRLPIPSASADPLSLEVPKTADVSKTITLEARNTVVLRGPVTGSSVANTMKKLRAVSQNVSKNTPIYLVLDTPGGSIMDGLDLIDFANALPQKVHTVTLFAASMGFQIAQNLNTRYIIRNGTLMSHRASVSGLGGQVKGELESRYKMIRRAVDFLDYKASARMGMPMKDYESLVVPEYWVYGYDAVAAKVADEEVLVRCGESLSGSEELAFNTFFGTVLVTFSQCPLMKEPEKIDLARISDPAKTQQLQEVFGIAFQNKPRFIREYITTDRFYEIFR